MLSIEKLSWTNEVGMFLHAFGDAEFRGENFARGERKYTIYNSDFYPGGHLGQRNVQDTQALILHIDTIAC